MEEYSGEFNRTNRVAGVSICGSIRCWMTF